MKKLFDDKYRIRQLTVDECTEHKNLENHGADEFRKKVLRENGGLPFWLNFDKNGKLLADSKMRKEGVSIDADGESIGCPASNEEVAYFIKLLKHTSTLTEHELKIIEDRFSKNK